MTKETIRLTAKLIANVVCKGEILCENERAFFSENIKEIYLYSKSNDLSHLIAEAAFSQKLIDSQSEYFEKFKKMQLMAFVRNSRLQKELEDICRVLNEAKIFHIPLKGSVLCNYYPESWMRTTADLDVLVKREDLERAIYSLEKNLQYSQKGGYLHDVFLNTPTGLHFELHFELDDINKNDFSAKLRKRVWEYVEPISKGEYTCRMSEEYFYFYQIYHAAKHLLNGGCGMRSVLDVWVLQNLVPHDKEKRRELIDMSGLTLFEKHIIELSKGWFDGVCIQDETVGWLENFIFTGGVFGNQTNHMIMHQRRKGGRFKYILTRIFLPYDQIKFYYPILKKHKWLTPFLQPVRWFNIIFGGRVKRSIEEIAGNYNVPKEISEKTEKLITRLGLYPLLEGEEK